MKNKRGAEMTIGTLVIIVLAVVVLVFLIFGFTTGWGNLWGKIFNFGGGKVNVDAVITGCGIACDSQAEYDWCKTRELIEEDAAGKIVKRPIKCTDLTEPPYTLDKCDAIVCTPGSGDDDTTTPVADTTTPVADDTIPDITP